MSRPLSLYSAHAVMAFTVFFSPIFGGVLLRQNLLDAGMPQRARITLLVSVLFTLINALIFVSLKNPSTFHTFFLNLAWGVVFIELFYKKWLGDLEYTRKSIRKPLGISLLIVLVFMLLMMV